MYHATDHPLAEQTGLDPQLHPFDDQLPDAVFVSVEPARLYGRYVYQIDTEGLKMIEDPHHFEQSFMVCQRIEPERITLIES